MYMRNIYGKKDSLKERLFYVFPHLTFFFAALLFSTVWGESEIVDMEAEIVNQVVEANTKFAIDLYGEMSKEDPNGNLFFSPLSLSTVLSMTLAGARQNTESEMCTVLGVKDIDRTSVHACYKSILATLGPVVTIANRLFIQEKFHANPEFLKIMEQEYRSTCTNVDFAQPAAKVTINEWVNKETKGKIESLVDSLDPNTAMVIANAIYFKSFWSKQFDRANTAVAPFHVNENEIVNVNMMYQREKLGLAHHELTDTDVLELDHKNGQTSMLIFLPRNGSLSNFESQFEKAVLDEVLSKMQVMKVKLWLPAFKLEESYKMETVLQNLGMKDLFSFRKANLSGISPANDLYASKVIHKSFIEVNEEGTEAAAASAVILMKRSLCIEPVIRIDRPFMFAILEKQTKNILFLGRLVRPAPVDVHKHEEL